MATKNPFKYATGKRVEITNNQTKQIKDLYKELYDDVRRELRYISKSTSEYAIVRQEYLRGLRQEYSEAIRNIDRQTETIVRNNMDYMVQIVLDNNQQYLSGLGYNSYINNPLIKSDVINRLVTGDIYGGKWNLSSAIWGDNSKKLNEINKIIAKGVAENKSVYDIARQLSKFVNPSRRSLMDIDGIRGRIDYNSIRLARTSIQHAYEEAFVSATRLNPFIDAYRWITSGGPNVCPLCIERATEDKYGLGEGIFPKGSLPLDHPNGQCTFEVVVTMSNEEISEAIADWYLGEGDPRMNEKLDKFANYLKNA